MRAIIKEILFLKHVFPFLDTISIVWHIAQLTNVKLFIIFMLWQYLIIIVLKYQKMFI
jgi:hypothetical protein